VSVHPSEFCGKDERIELADTQRLFSTYLTLYLKNSGISDIRITFSVQNSELRKILLRHADCCQLSSTDGHQQFITLNIYFCIQRDRRAARRTDSYAADTAAETIVLCYAACLKGATIII